MVPARDSRKTEFNDDRPLRLVLDLMADKWVPGLIFALSEGPQRPRDLVRHLSGISPKMLAQTLRKLETCGLVDRQVYKSGPPRVVYSLSAMGRKFTEPLMYLREWSEENVETIHAILRRWDLAP